MAVTVTKSTLTAYNTQGAITSNAATVDTANGTEVFTIVPTKNAERVLLRIKNGPTHGSLTYSVAVGVGVGKAGAALTGTVTQDTVVGIVLETGKYANASGAYVITFTPATGKKLTSEHALTVECVQLP